MKATLSVTVEAALKQSLQAMKAKIEDARNGVEGGWFPDLAKFEAQQQEATWASEGAKSGEKWPELSEGVGNMKGYESWKGRNWPGRKMNVWRGDTRDSFRHVSNPDHIARLDGGTMVFGSKAKLASKMHLGTSDTGWQKAFLKEATPVPRKPKKSKFAFKTLTTIGANGKAKTKTETRTSLRHYKPRKWFVFWFKTIPARPLARKSPVQVQQLKLKIAQLMTKEMAMACPSPRVRAMLGKMAAEIRANPGLG